MVGAALECVHCYSLVHDDLPAMDNDALRRGRPTVHTAYDDATAILVGDGLLTFAFDILAALRNPSDATVRVELVSALAQAAGLGGMVGGQMLDLAAEGRFADGRPQPLAEEEIAQLQRMKTGALLRYACHAGAVLGKAEPEQQPGACTAMVPRSARPSRSPMICSTWKAARRPWGNRQARMRPPAKPRWSVCSARQGREPI